MEINEALQIIKNACSSVRGTLQEHQMIQEAFTKIVTEITKNKKEIKPVVKEEKKDE